MLKLDSLEYATTLRPQHGGAITWSSVQTQRVCVLWNCHQMTMGTSEIACEPM